MKIIIPGVPIPQARPRFARFGNHVKTYDSQRAEKTKIKADLYKQIPTAWKLLEGELNIHIVFYMPRPKSHYGTGKNKAVLKKNAPKLHTNKPDIDNLQKMVYDCLNRVIIRDDSSICESYCRKEYSCDPRTVITITGRGLKWVDIKRGKNELL